MNVTSNWDTATPEQKDKIMDNVVQALQTLHRSVVKRYINHLNHHKNVNQSLPALNIVDKSCTFCQKKHKKE